jgi:hypothetical protein
VTALPFPTFLSAKAPAAVVDCSVTLSDPTIPCKVAPLAFSVAVVLPSYTLSFAVTPVIVRGFDVIFAVVVEMPDERM